MADSEHFEDDRGRGAAARHEGRARHPAAGPSTMGTIANWAGAAVSLGLVVGMGVWAYQLTMRDVAGVPVIRALEGPVRVPPADPGGVQAEHQGLAVNRLAEGAEAGPVPDRLVLAPPPVDLEAVQLASASAPAPVDAATPPPASADTADPAAGDPAATTDLVATREETRALIARLLEQAATGDPPEAAPVLPQNGETADAPVPAPAPDEDAPVAAATVIPASVPGVARSMIPAARPAVILARAGAPAAAGSAPQAAATAELDPAGLAEGTRLVQLGAYDTPEIAREEWDRLAARFPDFFADRARVIEEASSGGSAFYRLRAHGFEDLAAARRFCAALMAQAAPCIPVTLR